MKIIAGLLILIGLIDCRSKEKFNTDICSEKYINDKWKVTIFHSKEWAPYEFKDNNIGLDYNALKNFERRGDAGIVITFLNNSKTEVDFYKLREASQAKRASDAKSLGVELKSQTVDKGLTDFADKKWRTFETKESGSTPAGAFEQKYTQYLWYSVDIQIIIIVRLKGKEIDGLSSEIDCILKGLTFN